MSYFVYLRPAWMKATATMFPGSLDPLKLPLLYYAFPTPLKKFVKVFLILKQIPKFVFCIPTYFRIRVSAREFKVELQVFKALAVTLIDGLYVNLTLHLSMHFGKIQKFSLKKQRKVIKHSRFSVNWIFWLKKNVGWVSKVWVLNEKSFLG